METDQPRKYLQTGEYHLLDFLLTELTNFYCMHQSPNPSTYPVDFLAICITVTKTPEPTACLSNKPPSPRPHLTPRVGS
jgi:hypothetical protein